MQERNVLNVGKVSIFLYLAITLLLLAACSNHENLSANLLFKAHQASETGIDFINQLDYTEELNPYTFRSFYNGGGVGLGDFNNDGLLDVFFAGNLVSNKLYLNSGNFKFKDITAAAGLETEGVWTTGVSVVDINADGYLDIYLCKSGPPGGAKRKNELLINQGNLTFVEQAAKYGLDFEGLSIHAAFFDYDRDGDLDCYLLNNSLRSVGGFDLRRDQRKTPDPEGGNRLLRNDNSFFVDVSQPAGIYSSKIGFGLGVTIGDINKDGWPDIYVSNDFFERDYFYINNQDGTFSERLEDLVREISLGSMGADLADINNDGLPELFVTEMLPADDARLKTTSQFETWDKYQSAVDQGYYHQFSRNVLQLNNGNGTFSEISRLSGTAATDWSWGALIFDMNNDGTKDIFVANGIYKDLINQDYVNFIANATAVREILRKEKKVIQRLVDSIPSNQLPNYAFRNNGDLTFTNMASEWGLGLPTHSNGSAYGDLDNDGDLDLVLNNVNMPIGLYENQSEKLLPENKTISFFLHGEGLNTFAIGANVAVYADDKVFYQEVSPMRGFMSSVDPIIHIGVGAVAIVDSVKINWPNDQQTKLSNVAVGQLHTLFQKDATSKIDFARVDQPTVFSTHPNFTIDFTHEENDFVDFDRDRLLFNMISNEGPCLCTGDINGDGFDDFYIGGAKGQAGAMYIQSKSNGFSKIDLTNLTKDKDSEDTDCVFFDANGDGKPDLYVASGGNEFSSSSAALLDRLYMNEGNNHFKKSDQAFPVSTAFESTGTVSAADFDNDGDVDLFVGVRVIPFLYGLPGNGYILTNDGNGNFTNITSQIAPQLEKVGMITDSQWVDLNQDKKLDLVLVGEWMPIRIFLQEEGKFLDKTEAWGLKDTHGWYHSLSMGDFDKDGLLDIVAGNHGLNSRFKATASEPVSLYLNDFDQNGTMEQITTRFDNGVSYPLVLRHDLISQIPMLKKKYLHFSDYKGKTIEDIFSPDQISQSIKLNAYTFETAVWLNREGTFVKANLPIEAQFAPVYSILTDDFNQDGNLDLILGGNLYRAKPETGIYDGSYGLLLTGDGHGTFKYEPATRSGLLIKGEVRSLKQIKHKDIKLVLVGKNNDKLELLKYR
ncbi:MAG: VCBS repeat-containing protein [Cyclobacteriaceae bacterium]|nr:VCBS repeat-containing protein [Cyclobacteriaceae bacterium]